MINVTKTFLPPIEEYTKKLEKIWNTNWLTNHGPYVGELETKLKKRFGVKHLFLVNNGTIAMQIAIKALELPKGEIITTPFSYVATSSSIVWEGFKPVFVDINPKNLTINADKIEAAISPKTRAIMPVHVYGIPCDVEKIERIAKKHNLKVIYDAAHAFDVSYKRKSILQWGDISTLSFHATKLFHSIEGGAIVTNDDDLAHKISYMRNFGHETPVSFYGVGINGKMNEFCAAMGLLVLKNIKKIISKRKKIVELYDSLLLTNKQIIRPKIQNGVEYNYAYYPILLDTEKNLMEIMEELQKQKIVPRRYFYPSLNTLSYVKKQFCPISENLSSRVLCLPLHTELKKSDIMFITRIINSF